MGCHLRINDLDVMAEEGTTLFDAAESVGVRVPTSCRKQGKCRECLVEIESGAEFLSPLEPQEAHLGEGFRLSCRARLTGGPVLAHTMRRGSLRIERGSSQLERPTAEGRRPRFTRHGERLLRDELAVGTIASSPLGLALDLGNRPYDFTNETAAERDARLEAGWRKRTTGSPWRPRDERDAA